MSAVIKADGLSKRYMISHRREAPYGTLRDALAIGAKGVARRLVRPFANGRATSESKDFREEFWALRDVSFEVQQGERIGIIGRNGAGKSTLLKILSRITEPTRGRVEIRGRVASLLEVGTGFHPELTGRENIYLNAAVLGMSRADIRSKFDEIVAFSEVEQFLDTPVKRYSSGMYVRLAFSVAAHLEPDILVVDEVLAVGDMQFQKKCLGKMEEVGRNGRTVLFVSHNLAAIRTLCSKAIVLRAGRVEVDTGVADAIRTYKTGIVEGTLERKWNLDAAPGNSVATVTSIAILDQTGAIPTNLHTDLAFDVVVDYLVRVGGASVGMTVVVYDTEGNVVFSSISNHEPDWYGKPMPLGTYRSSCRVPGSLLNDGSYSLSLIVFGKGFTDQAVLRDVLRIEMADGPHVRGDYFGQYLGGFRPLLAWATRAT